LRAHSIGRSEEERRLLDYRLALQTARREIDGVVQQIDQVDDEIDTIRKDLHAREAQKDMLTERHLNLSSTIMALDALANGKSLVREIAAQTKEG
jgi:multidrug resistance efflux pump